VEGKGKADAAWLAAGYPAYCRHAGLGAAQDLLVHADLSMTALYAGVVDMARKHPPLFIPVKVGSEHMADVLAIACGKLGLVGMSKTQIETFKPPGSPR
jgi:hypothetical protein